MRRFKVAVVAVFLLLFVGFLEPLSVSTMGEANTEQLPMVGTAHAASSWAVTAPGGQLSARVIQEKPREALRLEILRDGTVLASSALGIITSQADLSSGLLFRSRADQSIEETYNTTVGKRHLHRLSANQMTLTFKGARATELRIQVRAATDGISYRYMLPGQGSVEVTEEASTFRPPSSASAWVLPFRPNYENIY
jgi:alpha-glucosidase